MCLCQNSFNLIGSSPDRVEARRDGGGRLGRWGGQREGGGNVTTRDHRRRGHGPRAQDQPCSRTDKARPSTAPVQRNLKLVERYSGSSCDITAVNLMTPGSQHGGERGEEQEVDLPQKAPPRVTKKRARFSLEVADLKTPGRS
jgi:hypothetical protein